MGPTPGHSVEGKTGDMQAEQWCAWVREEKQRDGEASLHFMHIYACAIQTNRMQNAMSEL